MNTFAAFGDSITALPGAPFHYINHAPDAELEANNTRSWVPWATAPDLTYVGGFSRGGARTTAIASSASPVLADITVVMGGTNDIGPAPWGVPIIESKSNLCTTIVESKALRALVAAVAPRNGAEAARTLEYNQAIKQYALSMGWLWCDPWAAMRKQNGEWITPAHTTDGVHPTVISAKMAGGCLSTAIRAALNMPNTKMKS